MSTLGDEGREYICPLMTRDRLHPVRCTDECMLRLHHIDNHRICALDSIAVTLDRMDARAEGVTGR